MRRRTELSGIPVVELDSGRVLGKVKDVDINLANGRLRGLVVALGRKEGFIPFDQIYHLGAAAVTVGAEAPILPHRREEDPFPVGKRVFNREGRVLGVIDDVLFDGESGSVWGYQVTAGLLSDFVDGKKGVALTNELVVGPDSVVITDELGLERPGPLGGRGGGMEG